MHGATPYDERQRQPRLPIKIDNRVKQWGRSSTRIKPVFCVEEMVNIAATAR